MAMKRSCLVLSAALFAVSALRRTQKKQDCFSAYDGKPLLEFSLATLDEARALQAKLEELECAEMDEGRGTTLLAICPAEQASELQNQFGKRAKVVVDDAGDFYRTSSGPAQGFSQPASNGTSAAMSTEFYTAWRTYEAQNAAVEAAVANSGGAAELYQIGTSVEGRPIMAVRIRGAGWTSGGPRVVINCQAHAREWITGMSCVYAVEMALERVKADPSWLAGTELAINPMNNPDGFVYSETSSRMWRKNRAVNAGSSCRGVDLNRNWDPDWSGRESTSSSKCSDVYYGPAAFSEPETQAVKALIDEAPVSIHLDVHAFGALILTSWSYTATLHPRRAEIDVPGKMMQDAIEAKHGQAYTYGGSEVLYPASGVCPDYSTSTGGFGFTYELRPSSQWGGGFAPGAAEILPTAEECWEGILAAISWSQNPRTTTAPPTDPALCPWHGCRLGCSWENCEHCERCQ